MKWIKPTRVKPASGGIKIGRAKYEISNIHANMVETSNVTRMAWRQGTANG